MLPQSLAFVKALQSDYDGDEDDDDDNESGTCLYSVSMTIDGHLICGLSGRVGIWDTNDGKLQHSTDVAGHMLDMKQYGDHLYGACLHDGQLTVVRYDRQLNNREEIVSIPYQANKLAQIDVRYGNIAVVNYDNKLINLYTMDREFVRDVKLRDGKPPRGVRLVMDSCVLVSNNCTGSVTKYQTDGSGGAVWRCTRLQGASALDVNEWGLIYVCGNSKIHLLSPEG